MPTVDFPDRKGKPGFKIDQQILNMLLLIRRKTFERDSETVIVMYGDVGCGKSLLAMRWGYVIDPTINLKRVCFDPEEFVQAVTTSQKQVVIGDEAIGLFFSRQAMTGVNKDLIEMMNQARQRNLVMIFCVPDLTLIDQFLLSKAKLIVRVWESNKQRKKGHKVAHYKGHHELYTDFPNYRAKTNLYLYLRGKKANPNAKKIKPKPFLMSEGTLLNPKKKIKVFYPVSEKGYRAKKEKVLQDFKTRFSKKAPVAKTTRKVMEQRNNLIYELVNNGKSYVQVGETLNLLPRTIKDVYDMTKRRKNDKKK